MQYSLGKVPRSMIPWRAGTVSCWKTFYYHMTFEKSPQVPHLANTYAPRSRRGRHLPTMNGRAFTMTRPPWRQSRAEAYNPSKFLKGRDFSSKLKIPNKRRRQSTSQQGPHQRCPRCTPHTSRGHRSPGLGPRYNLRAHGRALGQWPAAGHVLPTASRAELVRSGQLPCGWRVCKAQLPPGEAGAPRRVGGETDTKQKSFLNTCWSIKTQWYFFL